MTRNLHFDAVELLATRESGGGGGGGATRAKFMLQGDGGWRKLVSGLIPTLSVVLVSEGLESKS